MTFHDFQYSQQVLDKSNSTESDLLPLGVKQALLLLLTVVLGHSVKVTEELRFSITFDQREPEIPKWFIKVESWLLATARIEI